MEGNKKVLSSLTHSLTDCETAMEEHELKIRLLKEKLKVSEQCEGLRLCVKSSLCVCVSLNGSLQRTSFESVK